MKCTNCGFNNDAKAARCVKCNSELNAPYPNENIPVPQLSGTLAGQQASPNGNGASFAKTLLGEQAKESYIDRPPFPGNGPAPDASSGAQCPNCGYQIMAHTRFCPNCNADIAAARPASAHKAAPVVNFNATIDPYSQKGFSLRPIVNGEAAKSRIEFSGGTTVLNRDNTIKDNLTITSKAQAEIRLENREWYLVDQSEKQTTFIRADEPRKLKKGDIILLGDTKFIFE